MCEVNLKKQPYMLALPVQDSNAQQIRQCSFISTYLL